MELTVDLRRDEIADLQKALVLINDAISERSGQRPAQSAPANHVPTIDSLRSNQGVQSQPSSTGLFNPRPQQAPSASSSFLPSTPRQSAPAASNQESFNMLNMLSGKKK